MKTVKVEQTGRNVHPLLGVDLSVWRVENYSSTVELRRKTDGRVVVIPKPYTSQSADWWKEQAKVLTA